MDQRPPRHAATAADAADRGSITAKSVDVGELEQRGRARRDPGHRVGVRGESGALGGRRADGLHRRVGAGRIVRGRRQVTHARRRDDGLDGRKLGVTRRRLATRRATDRHRPGQVRRAGAWQLAAPWR